MTGKINFDCAVSRWDYFSFEKEALRTDLTITVTSVAIGIFLAATLVIEAPAPIILTIGLGVTVGILFAITIITYRRFSLSIAPKPLAPFPDSFPSDLLPLFFSYTDIGLNTIKALACTSKGCHKIAYTINDNRLKKVASIAQYIGPKAWEGFGWEFEENETKAPLIFPDIIRKLEEICPADSSKSKQAKETHAVLLMPRRVTLATFKILAKKQPYRQKGYRNLDKEIFSAVNFPIVNSYFVIATTALINGSNDETLKQHSERISSLSPVGEGSYRFPKIIEVLALAHLYKSAFNLSLFNHSYTRTLEIVDDYETSAGSFDDDGLYITDTGPDVKWENIGVIAALATTNS
jgi:hypothetical protein